MRLQNPEQSWGSLDIAALALTRPALVSPDQTGAVKKIRKIGNLARSRDRGEYRPKMNRVGSIFKKP
jgi:hypothetical protein